MTSALMTESKNGLSDVVVRRESRNKIVVFTAEPLSDDQMNDLFSAVLIMVKGKRRLWKQLDEDGEPDGRAEERLVCRTAD